MPRVMNQSLSLLILCAVAVALGPAQSPPPAPPARAPRPGVKTPGVKIPIERLKPDAVFQVGGTPD